MFDSPNVFVVMRDTLANMPNKSNRNTFHTLHKESIKCPEVVMKNNSESYSEYQRNSILKIFSKSVVGKMFED